MWEIFLVSLVFPFLNFHLSNSFPSRPLSVLLWLCAEPRCTQLPLSQLCDGVESPRGESYPLFGFELQRGVEEMTLLVVAVHQLPENAPDLHDLSCRLQAQTPKSDEQLAVWGYSRSFLFSSRECSSCSSCAGCRRPSRRRWSRGKPQGGRQVGRYFLFQQERKYGSFGRVENLQSHSMVDKCC